MDSTPLLQSSVVWVCLAICAVLATFGAMMEARRGVLGLMAFTRKLGLMRYKGAAESYTAEFEEALETFRNKVESLHPFSGDYVGVFNQANWSHAVQKISALEAAYDELVRMLDSGEYMNAACLAEFLCAGDRELEPWKYDNIAEEWDSLYNWKADLHDIICGVVDVLERYIKESLKQGLNKDIRQPTAATLQKLKEF